MAKKSQAAKRHRQSLVKKARNYAYRSRLRTFVKKARIALAEKTENKEALVAEACRELDRMVTKGVLHKNNASRRKSRLTLALQGKKQPVVVAPRHVDATPEPTLFAEPVEPIKSDETTETNG